MILLDRIHFNLDVFSTIFAKLFLFSSDAIHQNSTLRIWSINTSFITFDTIMLHMQGWAQFNNGSERERADTLSSEQAVCHRAKPSTTMSSQNSGVGIHVLCHFFLNVSYSLIAASQYLLSSHVTRGHLCRISRSASCCHSCALKFDPVRVRPYSNFTQKTKSLITFSEFL